MTDRIPSGLRPGRAVYLALAQILKDDLYLWMTRGEFVDYLLEASPTFSRAAFKAMYLSMYLSLMDEAGVPELLSDEDGGEDIKEGIRATPRKKIIDAKLAEFGIEAPF